MEHIDFKKTCDIMDRAIEQITKWKRRAEKGADEIIRLSIALRAVGNAIGTPIPSYYSPEMQLKYYKLRETEVANIIVNTVKVRKS